MVDEIQREVYKLVKIRVVVFGSAGIYFSLSYLLLSDDGYCWTAKNSLE